MTAHQVRARVPGSIGNVGPGLDILGLAVTGAWDEVVATHHDGSGIIVTDAGHPDLPNDPERNTAAIAAAAVAAVLGDEQPIALSITKGLPLAGGQGGSAASAVAGAVAANALLGGDLDVATLLACTLKAESTVAGRHLDNLAPSLLGGFVLVRSLDPIEVIELPVPEGLQVILVLPDQQMRTSAARDALPREVSLELALHQAANIASMAVAACLGDIKLFARSIDDRIAEPARAPLLPGFVEAQRAALEVGALACSISGSGPTAFALVDDETICDAVAAAMTDAYANCGFDAVARITTVDQEGATIS